MENGLSLEIAFRPRLYYDLSVTELTLVRMEFLRLGYSRKKPKGTCLEVYLHPETKFLLRVWGKKKGRGSKEVSGSRRYWVQLLIKRSPHAILRKAIQQLVKLKRDMKEGPPLASDAAEEKGLGGSEDLGLGSEEGPDEQLDDGSPEEDMLEEWYNEDFEGEVTTPGDGEVLRFSIMSPRSSP